MVCLLLVPLIKFNLFWYSGWLSAYLILGILSPLILELAVRKRSLSTIGFRAPINKGAMSFVALLIGLYLISKLVIPLASGADFTFTWKRFISNSFIFALLEEVVFRGQIQTRLESALGTVKSWILSGLFFGFYHNYLDYATGKALDVENLLKLLFITTLGMLLGVIFAKTRSLLPSYLVHAINNLSLFAM